MIKQDDAFSAIREKWPEVDAFLAMSPEEREADTLKTLNDARATIGGTPLAHLPSEVELAQSRADRKRDYQKQYHSWPARWDRFLDRLLGPA